MENRLLHTALERVLAELDAGAEPAAVGQAAGRAIRAARDDDPEIGDSDAGVAVELQERDELARLVAGWRDGTLALPVADRAVLKRAMKALRKRLKLARLDDESSLGGRGLTGGRQSAISAVRAPEQYPTEVWELLARLGRVRDLGHGLLEPVGD